MSGGEDALCDLVRGGVKLRDASEGLDDAAAGRLLTDVLARAEACRQFLRGDASLSLWRELVEARDAAIRGLVPSWAWGAIFRHLRRRMAEVADTMVRDAFRRDPYFEEHDRLLTDQLQRTFPDMETSESLHYPTTKEGPGYYVLIGWHPPARTLRKRRETEPSTGVEDSWSDQACRRRGRRVRGSFLVF